MATQYPDASQTERELSLSFPQEFKEHLEDLVFEILKEKPSDPLEYAFNFFSQKLKTREEISLTGTKIDGTKITIENHLVAKREGKYYCPVESPVIQSRTAVGNMTETQAATIIQAYFRGYNVRQNSWKRRYLITSLPYHDHLGVTRNLMSPRGSFSLCWPETENFLAVTNYDSEGSVDS